MVAVDNCGIISPPLTASPRRDAFLYHEGRVNQGGGQTPLVSLLILHLLEIPPSHILTIFPTYSISSPPISHRRVQKKGIGSEKKIVLS